MSKRVKSARGQLVDFDLLKIKEQIASAPPPVDVQQRQDFVERRLRRKVKKKEITVESGGETTVEPNMPSPDDSVGELKVEEKTETTKTKAKTTKAKTRQPARKSTSNETNSSDS